jgi:hypothetical protein
VASHCWNYDGYVKPDGYGSTWDAGLKQSVNAHRRYYEAFRGRVPEGMHVLHKCDNRRCINPEHLFLGTADDNMRDMAQKGRSLSGERNKNCKLTQRQVDEIRGKYGMRGVTLQQLASEYGISAAHVHRIAKDKNWKGKR